MIEIPHEYYSLLQSGYDTWALGGRSGYKSTCTAIYLINEARNPDRAGQVFLCARETAVSIKDSSYATLVNWIERMKAGKHFRIFRSEILCLKTKVRIIFKGLQDTSSVKSIDNLTIFWIEEGETLSRKGFADVENTARRNNGAQAIVTFNPRFEDDFSFQFVREFYEKAIESGKNLFSDAVCEGGVTTNFFYVNYLCNKWIPDDFLKKIELKRIKDFARYQHEFLGHILKNDQACVFFGKWRTASFQRPASVSVGDVMIGMDFGYKDPTTVIWCYEHEGALYIEKEYYETDMTEDGIYNAVKGDKDINSGVPVIADSAAAQTIAGLREKGLKILSAVKGKDSVLSGIQRLKEYDEIIVHTSCKNVIWELNNYKWQVHKKTEAILNEPEDANNHTIDAIRYATNSNKPKWELDVII